MRIQLLTCKNNKIVPFDYPQKLIGTIHKWLGNNEIHDKISLYSYSWLLNGEIAKDGFTFQHGATWIISFYEDSYVKQLIRSILADPVMFCGLSVIRVQIMDDSLNDVSQCLFRLASPILIKRKEKDDRIKFYTYENTESNNFMVETLKNKMKQVGIPDDDTLKISFDLSYKGRKIKKVSIHNIDNIANMCPIIICGRTDVIQFARMVGFGNSTGSGFGCVY